MFDFKHDLIPKPCANCAIKKNLDIDKNKHAMQSSCKEIYLEHSVIPSYLNP